MFKVLATSLSILLISSVSYADGKKCSKLDLKETFNKVDKDQSNSLSFSEFKKLHKIKKAYKKCKRKTPREIFNKKDKNKDAELSLKELKNSKKHKKGRKRKSRKSRKSKK